MTDEHKLRRMLAYRIAGHLGYYDDGELQDNSQHPSIDFLRDTPDDIERKLRERWTKTLLQGTQHG